jgi:hypothetical protein
MSNVAIDVLDGVTVHGNQVMLTDGGKAVDLLRVAMPARYRSRRVTAAAGTTLTLVAALAGRRRPSVSPPLRRRKSVGDAA